MDDFISNWKAMRNDVFKHQLEVSDGIEAMSRLLAQYKMVIPWKLTKNEFEQDSSKIKNWMIKQFADKPPSPNLLSIDLIIAEYSSHGKAEVLTDVALRGTCEFEELKWMGDSGGGYIADNEFINQGEKVSIVVDRICSTQNPNDHFGLADRAAQFYLALILINMAKSNLNQNVFANCMFRALRVGFASAVELIGTVTNKKLIIRDQNETFKMFLSRFIDK